MAEWEAGLALNCQVAERVMGWRRIRPSLSVAPGHYMGDPPGATMSEVVPSYSTESAPAMTVFERMIERVGYGLIVADMEDCHGHGLVYWVRFATVDGSGEVAHSGPLAEAVCQAALAALAAADQAAADAPGVDGC